MKTTTARKGTKAATPATNANSTSVRVCIPTAEVIATLAEDHDQPPAVIAGILARIGTEVLTDDECTRLAGTSFEAQIMRVIRRKFPQAKCDVPLLTEEWTEENALIWSRDIGRTKAEWIGYMVEIGRECFQARGLLSRLITCPQKAFFLAMGAEIRSDNQFNPESAELLKPAAKTPPALLSFERLLAAKGGSQ